MVKVKRDCAARERDELRFCPPAQLLSQLGARLPESGGLCQRPLLPSPHLSPISLSLPSPPISSLRTMADVQDRLKEVADIPSSFIKDGSQVRPL